MPGMHHVLVFARFGLRINNSKNTRLAQWILDEDRDFLSSDSSHESYHHNGMPSTRGYTRGRSKDAYK